MKDASPFCSLMIVSSDHWGLNAVQLCGMILKIAFSEAITTVSFSTLCSFFAAETVMDTRVATAELGWTAYPNSGVSRSLPTHAHIENKKQKKTQIKTEVLCSNFLGGR